MYVFLVHLRPRSRSHEVLVSDVRERHLRVDVSHQKFLCDKLWNYNEPRKYFGALLVHAYFSFGLLILDLGHDSEEDFLSKLFMLHRLTLNGTHINECIMYSLSEQSLLTSTAHSVMVSFKTSTTSATHSCSGSLKRAMIPRTVAVKARSGVKMAVLRKNTVHYNAWLFRLHYTWTFTSTMYVMHLILEGRLQQCII